LPQVRQPRLFLGVDHAHFDAEATLEVAHERAPVAGAAHGAGRDHAQLGDLAGAERPKQLRERLDVQEPGALVDSAVGEHLRSEQRVALDVELR
jgi:hypothetical protein